MKTNARHVQITIAFGLICGLSLIPLNVGLSYIMSWPNAMSITFWAYLAAYGLILTTWSQKDSISIAFPLLLALVAAFWVDSISAFLLIALGVLSWIRSGICYPQNITKRLFAEVALCYGGGILVAILTPSTMMTWALAVWLFFLIQALYFVIFEMNHKEQEDIQRDLFDQAKKQAEKILSSGL
jgi:hypothetical protein